MTSIKRSKFYVILIVFIIGMMITATLQVLLFNAKSNEERYDFESQVSNLTLFITDSLNKIENQFNLLVKMSEVSNSFNNDNYLARFSQLSFQAQSAPITFSIFEKETTNGTYHMRHISGKYAAQINNEKIKSEVETALLSFLHNDFRKLNGRRVNNVFLELESTGKISCLSREIFEPGGKRKILISCFQLTDILDEVIGRSSYGWLEVFLYLGSNKKGYSLTYSYSSNQTPPLSNPSNAESEKLIFLPSTLSFASDDLSLLFSFEGYVREANKFTFIPSILGTILTLFICSYLISLKKRNRQISLKVEEKTKAFHELNQDLEKVILKKEALFEKLHSSSESLRIITNSVNGVIWEADPNTMKYIYISEQIESVLGFKAEDYISGKIGIGDQEVPEGSPIIAKLMKDSFEGHDDVTLEYQGYRKDKELIWQRNNISKIFKNGVLVKVRGVIFDITVEKRKEEQRISMEGQLKHAQKMEAIGQLAAGIAHEINTPSQFVGDNLTFFADSIKDFTDYYKQLEALVRSTNNNVLTATLEKSKQKLDMEFLEEEVPLAIKQSIDGVSRISQIVSAMKDFSHPGKENKQKIDINRAIESTSIVASNEWKYIADMAFEFADALPQVNCFPGEINQVILNIIVNASHAIDSSGGKDGKGNIRISTQKENNNVIIKISDDADGMEDSVMERIFDPFFTTKEVGKGTGQGLSLAYAVMVDKHDGHISVESTVGEGTTFTIELPIG
jgi:signal transduction histidine kinase